MNKVVVGVDGCRGGWLAVIGPVGDRPKQAVIHATFKELMASLPKAAMVAVDIPIGLPESGSRECDILARQQLGWPRRCSVFPAPIRPCLKARDYQEASQILQKVDGKGMTKQAFGILEKIREVDNYLCSHADARARVVEIHPEVSFALWNGGVAMADKKKSAAGRTERSALIERRWQGAVSAMQELVRGKDFQMDDLLDAFAALWTAQRWAARAGQLRVLGSELDGNGLPMRIVA